MNVGEKLLKGTTYGARVNGVNVDVMLGHKVATLDWYTALKLAFVIWSAAKTAKARTGAPRIVLGLANLTDANMDEMKAQRARDGTIWAGK